MTEKTFVLAQKEPPPVPVVPKAAPSAPSAPPAPPPPQPVVVQPQTSGRVMTDLPLTQTDIVMVLAVTALVGLVALVPRALITRHLIGQRATPSSAGSAGWAAWLLFVVLALIVLTGALGHLWKVLLFYGPASAILALLLILAVMLFLRAQRTHR